MTEEAERPVPTPPSEPTEDWPRFLSGFVHELKTPLASLGMIAELLNRDTSRLSESERRYVDNLRHLTREMQNLVHDVGTLARLVGGRTAVQRRPVPLTEILDRAAENARSFGWERGVSLTIEETDETDLAVSTDPVVLWEALAAVLETAVVLARRQVWVRVAATDEEILVAVQPDEGCELGGDPRSLFDPFGGELSRQSKQKGGRVLGPLLARELTRALGGDLEFLFEQGRTRCRFRLPRAKS